MREQPVDQQGLEQGVRAAVTEAYPGDALPGVGGDRVVDGGEGFVGADRVMAPVVGRRAGVGWR